MQNRVEQCLESALTDRVCIGEIVISRTNRGFVVSHRDEESPDSLQTYRNPEDAIEIAKYDDAGKYRPLKTAPNLRRGWRLELDTVQELRRALNYFYPGRFAVFVAWKSGQLDPTPLRETLDRQSGMYRVAAKIADSQINDLAADFCRSDGGCLRTILWKRDQSGAIASTKLPTQKFDPSCDQAAVSKEYQRPTKTMNTATVPLLCQEACNLLVAECRKVAKNERAYL